jgi:large subunit ribosomal protein L13
MKSYIATPKDIKKDWILFDADGKTLGRFATDIAMVLMGKHKPTYTPFLDTGDYCIVINAEKVKVSGKKFENKTYVRHSGYPGGRKETTFDKMQETKPEEIIKHAVKGMLPKGRLGRQMIKKLKIYKGPEHTHSAQKPVPFEVK